MFLVFLQVNPSLAEEQIKIVWFLNHIFCSTEVKCAFQTELSLLMKHSDQEVLKSTRTQCRPSHPTSPLSSLMKHTVSVPVSVINRNEKGKNPIQQTRTWTNIAPHMLDKLFNQHAPNRLWTRGFQSFTQICYSEVTEQIQAENTKDIPLNPEIIKPHGTEPPLSKTRQGTENS